jgi:phytoene synthase
MAMDLTVTTYDTWEDLLVYMDGSAAVIGEMMLPVLEPFDAAAALPRARDLGNAFQLTNFLRDIDEDLDLGRVYVPQEDIAKFDASSAFAERRVTPELVDLLQFEIGRARELYASADLGVSMLPPASARCIAGARELYSGILGRIEAAGYDVFTSRASVPTWRKVAVAARTLSARGSGGARP